MSKTIEIQSSAKNQKIIENLFKEDVSYVQLGMLFMSAPIRFHDAIVNVFKGIGNVYLVKFIKHCYYNVFTFSSYDTNRVAQLITRFTMALAECQNVIVIMHCYLALFLLEFTQCPQFFQLYLNVLGEILNKTKCDNILVYTSMLMCNAAKSILSDKDSLILRTGIVKLKEMCNFA